MHVTCKNHHTYFYNEIYLYNYTNYLLDGPIRNKNLKMYLFIFQIWMTDSQRMKRQ